jgi:hypothetical protein
LSYIACLAEADFSNSRIVIARSGVDVQTPVINVDMLDLNLLFSNMTRDEHMVKLLGVLVEDVGVPFDVRKVGKLIYLMKD